MCHLVPVRVGSSISLLSYRLKLPGWENRGPAPSGNSPPACLKGCRANASLPFCVAASQPRLRVLRTPLRGLFKAGGMAGDSRGVLPQRTFHFVEPGLPGGKCSLESGGTFSFPDGFGRLQACQGFPPRGPGVWECWMAVAPNSTAIPEGYLGPDVKGPEGTWSLGGCWQGPEGRAGSRGTWGWGEPHGGGGIAAGRWAAVGPRGTLSHLEGRCLPEAVSWVLVSGGK